MGVACFSSGRAGSIGITYFGGVVPDSGRRGDVTLKSWEDRIEIGGAKNKRGMFGKVLKRNLRLKLAGK